MDIAAPVEITPTASALIQSLRGLGYSPEAALADLVDNSIAAGAGTVEIDLQWNDNTPQVAVLDDGCGLTHQALTEAMRLGGAGPAIPRGLADLGRFGMGLKTASLSQSRRVTVITRQAGRTSSLCLDVDVIAEQGWVALIPDPFPDHPFVPQLLAREHGTLVFWDRMDALGGLTGLDKKGFFLRLEDIRAHIGMIFHRFIAGDATRVAISINGRQVKGWDPFLVGHPATTKMREETIRYGTSSLSVQPYVLPHRDRFANESEYEAAGGPGGWGARQGFYVYRGKRLLVAGSWLGLGGTRTWTREQSSRLARIGIDLPTDMDTDWRIDVRKSQARPPGKLRPRLTAIAGRCREQAREVFAWRGRGPRNASHRGVAAAPVWLARSTPNGTQYRINREHPAVAGLSSHKKPDAKQIEALLAVIERTVPVERIWLDTSEAEGTVPPSLDAEERKLLTSQLLRLDGVLPPDMPSSERVDILLGNLPGDLTELRTELTRKLEGKL